MSQGDKGGPKHKIPEDRWAEVYTMYQTGADVETIYKKVTEEWKIEVSERSLYTLIKQLRTVKAAQLTDLIGADTADALGRYRWLQEQLEEMAIHSKSNKEMFLKIADRLTHMYEFQMSFTQTLPNKNAKTDNGRDELLKELSAHLMVPNVVTNVS
jgi:NADH:ubiquinone oxidoreductase subunit C